MTERLLTLSNHQIAAMFGKDGRLLRLADRNNDGEWNESPAFVRRDEIAVIIGRSIVARFETEVFFANGMTGLVAVEAGIRFLKREDEGSLSFLGRLRMPVDGNRDTFEHALIQEISSIFASSLRNFAKTCDCADSSWWEEAARTLGVISNRLKEEEGFPGFRSFRIADVSNPTAIAFEKEIAECESYLAKVRKEGEFKEALGKLITQQIVRDEEIKQMQDSIPIRNQGISGSAQTTGAFRSLDVPSQDRIKPESSQLPDATVNWILSEKSSSRGDYTRTKIVTNNLGHLDTVRSGQLLQVKIRAHRGGFFYLLTREGIKHGSGSGKWKFLYANDNANEFNSTFSRIAGNSMSKEEELVLPRDGVVALRKDYFWELDSKSEVWEDFCVIFTRERMSPTQQSRLSNATAIGNIPGAVVFLRSFWHQA